MSKTIGVERLQEALALGITEFGENRVQEAQSKWPALKAAHPGVKLHLIGPLQTNKTAEAVSLFDVIHTLDRPKLADSLAKECAKQNRWPSLLIQINTGEEPQKAGVPPRKAKVLLAYAQELKLPVIGLMCVPPVGENPAPHFALLEKMATEMGLNELSMGMSSDYITAARLGSTMVRIGTALFGERK